MEKQRQVEVTLWQIQQGRDIAGAIDSVSGWLTIYDSLTARQRLIYDLKVEYSWPEDKIARIMGITVNNVRVTWTKIKKRFQRCVR